MFTKHDIEFEEMAADSVRRRAVIASLSWRRVVVFWGSLALMVAAFVEYWGGSTDALTILGAAIFCSLYVKMESDLRFLRLIDRLQKGGDAKATVLQANAVKPAIAYRLPVQDQWCGSTDSHRWARNK